MVPTEAREAADANPACVGLTRERIKNPRFTRVAWTISGPSSRVPEFSTSGFAKFR